MPLRIYDVAHRFHKKQKFARHRRELWCLGKGSKRCDARIES